MNPDWGLECFRAGIDSAITDLWKREFGQQTFVRDFNYGKDGSKWAFELAVRTPEMEALWVRIVTDFWSRHAAYLEHRELDVRKEATTSGDWLTSDNWLKFLKALSKSSQSSAPVGQEGAPGTGITQPKAEGGVNKSLQPVELMRTGAETALSATADSHMVAETPSAGNAAQVDTNLIKDWMNKEGYTNESLARHLRLSERVISSLRNNGRYHGRDAITKLANLMSEKDATHPVDPLDLYLP
jgi:hypothetical protein